MKKCKKCGALQNDNRSVCIDCGAVLGRSMTEEEETRTEDALSDRLYDLSERTEDFYVPVRDKIIGVLCMIGAVAAILLLNFIGTEKRGLQANVSVNTVGDTIDYVVYSSGFNAVASRRVAALNRAGCGALIALISCGVSIPMLLFPRLMWNLDTLKYRLFYNWDTTPSDMALVLRKALTYGLCVIGAIAILYGWIIFAI